MSRGLERFLNAFADICRLPDLTHGLLCPRRVTGFTAELLLFLSTVVATVPFKGSLFYKGVRPESFARRVQANIC